MSLIIVQSKDYINKDALDNVITYALKTDKNDSSKVTKSVEWNGFGVNDLTPEYMIDSMNNVKRRYKKEDGKLLHHFVLSIYQKYFFRVRNKEIWCQLVTNEVGNYLCSKGYQATGFIHVNYDGNVHVHFIFNSVNAYTGKKLTNEKIFYNDLLHFLKMNFYNLNWEKVQYNKD